MRIIKNSKFFEILFIFLISLTPFLWLNNGYVILGHDSGFRLDQLQYWKNLLYSWNPISNFGTDWSLFKGFIVTQFPETFFSTLVGSLATGERLTFVFWFFIIGISFYIFINSFFSEKKYWIMRILGSTFYMYNFFLLQAWFIAERAKFSTFAALPLGFLVIYKTLTKQYSLIKGAAFFSLLFFVFNGGGAPTLLGAPILLYGISILSLTYLNILKHGLKEIWYSVRLVAFFLIGSVLLNAYWILPQFSLFLNNYVPSLASVGGIEGILGWEATISKNASFLNLFRLQGIPDWYDNASHPYASEFLHNPFLVIFSFIFITVILLGLLLRHKFPKKQRRDNVFFIFFLIFLVGLIFTAGSHPPFGEIYALFIKYIPGFTIFRSSFYKFGAILWFPMIFLFAYSLNMLLIRYIKHKIYYRMIGIFAIFFILLYHYPFFAVNFFLWNKPFTTKIQLPAYVTEMSSYVNSKTNEYEKILMLPSIDDFDAYEWGYFSLDSLPTLLVNRPFIKEPGASIGISNQIYKAIVEKDNSTFLYLTGVFGIKKILWQDDLLSQGKIITSQEFEPTKQKLLQMQGVSVEKSIGKWTLYDIKSPYFLPFIYSPTTLSYSDFNMEYFLNSIKDNNRTITLSSPRNEQTLNNLKSFVNDVKLKAECIACTDDFIGFTQGKRILQFIPRITLLPDSVLYPYVEWTEGQMLRNTNGDKSKLVDAYLSLSNKRFAEYFEIIKRTSKTRSQNLIEETIKKYKTNISSAIKEADETKENERNYNYIKIYLYLAQQEQYITLPFYKSSIDIREYINIIDYINKNIAYIKNKAWITKSMDDLKYEFSISNIGNYRLEVGNSQQYPERIYLDGSAVYQSINLTIREGIHYVELKYPQQQNLFVDTDSSEGKTIRLKPNERVKFGIDNFNAKNIYEISFEYKLIDGDVPNFSVYQYRNGMEDKQIAKKLKTLYADYKEVWNKFDYVFTPYPGFDQAGMSIFILDTKDSAKKSVFEIRNFKVTQVFIPDVFLTREITSNTFPAPKISYTSINPTRYIAHVQGASANFVLGFQENYNMGWKIYYADKKKSDIGDLIMPSYLPEKNHFITNQYTNSWIVDRKGTYDIVIEYAPQRISYIGIIVSLMSLSGCLVYIVSSRFKNEN